MPLSEYHNKYIKRTDEELQRRISVKEEELRKIFSELSYKPTSSKVRVAVLGCADRRFVKGHKDIFEKLLSNPVVLTTFDITTDHLQDAEGAVQHDITEPLPNPPYDITFGHVVLKFIETEKQWAVLKNSYNALCAGGIAIHVFDEEDVTTDSVRQTDGYFSVPMERWKKLLTENKIKFHEMRWSMTLENIPIPIRGLRGGVLVLIKD
ncbi:MAG TPA: hypothetical protein DD653_03245 [Marinilabiliales bacterium]|nr:hypothetical protein [Marinilabiliales bacterium]